MDNTNTTPSAPADADQTPVDTVQVPADATDVPVTQNTGGGDPPPDQA